MSVKSQVLLSVISLAVLTACQTAGGFVPNQEIVAMQKAGLSRAQMYQDYTECRIQGVKEIPVSTQTRYMGGIYNPGTVSCNTFGNTTSCNTYGAMNVPATMSSYDANEPVRRQAFNLCLSKKGYSMTKTRTCEQIDDMTTEGCVVPFR